ncbi:MAG: Tryptophanyl-tRNA synthetase [Candidatus Roizmanbacteria bacterium GW2011_GWA2_35_19]|uniref:Tryptophan--tRNA ligase n=2 Tax=Candidatus Roizmaniibacteriota TaxID=1752723 RepID=A0A0G0EGY6_9BACT|nr:MAG: Tryptophanyl-tRNA synthetase [Candidatus Roizmanbacteria bacterium GW2011_GWC2_35_12]KKP74485.1 MAG: Tryptophanyl-tRNA synthetase [Candidatus Roizmanbacteria bacterium GW2011_GWA2_35_19]
MIDKMSLEYSKKMTELGIKNKILEHDSLVEAADVVAQLGYTLNDSVATLIMKADKNYIAVLRRDVTKISFKKIKKLLGISELQIATPEEFNQVTGLEIGTARFYVENVKTYIDKKVFEKKTILGGTGSLSTTFRCLSKDLKKLPNIQIVDITSEIEEVTNLKSVKRVFSGIRATGRLHLGNYLGAVKGFLELEKTGKYETVYCVVDIHSITTPYDKKALAKNKREIIIDYLAAGLDPKKSIIIYQSDIPEHIELAFYFSTVETIARMMHLPTYKEKVKQHPNANTMALLNYPILMAADILIYKAGLVPVGIDQEPHLEVTREIARKMNQLYGTDFPEPVRFATKGEYIPSLTGEGKMSKTVANSFINLTDSLEEIRKKIRSVPTATSAGGEMSPGLKSLFAFANLFLPAVTDRYKKEFNDGTLQFVKIKDAIAEAIYADLKPFQERRAKIAADKNYVDGVIRDGADRARKIARETVKEVKEKMGLL